MRHENEHNDSSIFRRLESVAPAFALLAGMQQDIFTPLKDGPMDSKTLAAALGVSADKLSPLLYALVTADLLKVENGVFSNTNEADRLLVRGNPDYIGESAGLYSWFWRTILQSADTIRTGVAQARLDWSAMNEDQRLESFRDAFPRTLASGRQLAARYDFSRFRRLMDAGGGSGGIAIGLCETFPDLEATIVDLPLAASLSERFISENNMSDRIKAIAADLTENAPAGDYDVAIVRNLICTLLPEQAKAVIINIGKVLEKGGIIYIIDVISDDTRLSPASVAAFYSLLYLNIYDNGRAYTESEHRNWLTAAGFVDVKVEYEAMYAFSIITARKAY